MFSVLHRICAIVALVLVSSASSALTIDLDAQANASTDGSNGISVLLGAGTWNVDPVAGAFVAWSDFNSERDCSPAGTGCSRGWHANFAYSSASLGTVRLSPAAGFFFETPALALSTAEGTSFSLAAPETVTFFLSSGATTDNRGGLTLSIVPEPGTAVLFGLGLGCLARRRSPRISRP